MLDVSDRVEDRSLRRARLALRLGVGAVWLLGVVLAIRSGWVPPGLGDPMRPWVYPLGKVLVVIAQISVVSLCLYDALRPQATCSFDARIGRATIVSFLILVWTGLNSGTDRPSYADVAGYYVAILTTLLLVTLITVAAVRAGRGGRHAA